MSAAVLGDTRIIDDPTELEELIAPRWRTNFELRFRELADDENAAWTTMLRRDYIACGCSEGATFMMVATFIVIGLVIAGALGWIPIEWTFARAGIALLAIIAAAGAGKAVGLARARRRLRTNVDRLTRALMHPPAPGARPGP